VELEDSSPPSLFARSLRKSIILLGPLLVVALCLKGSAQETSSLPESPLAANALVQAKQARIQLDQAQTFAAPLSPQNSPAPLHPEQKFVLATKDSFGLPAVVFAAAEAGLNQAQDLYPEFHQGASGYARNYWHSYADQTVDTYMVEFILPSVLHQDSRYYPLRQGGGWKRTEYSLSRLFITRADSGSVEFNTSQILGSGLAASVSSLYYPERDMNASIVTQRWLSNVAGDGLLMVLKEFTPDIGHAMRALCPHVGRPKNGTIQ
jgi:hypothetical protein